MFRLSSLKDVLIYRFGDKSKFIIIKTQSEHSDESIYKIYVFGFRLITSAIAKGTPNGIPFAMATLPAGELSRRERESP
jgi:hypothetical protein